jgi:polyisoprenoid-binding protein YceI
MDIRFLVPAIGLALGTAPIASAETYGLEKTHADLLFSINHAGFTIGDDITITIDVEFNRHP